MKKFASVVIVLSAVCLIPAFATAGPPTDAEKQAICEKTATMFRSARAVISKNQALINDASKGDKGLVAEVVLAAARENFEKATGEPFPEQPDTSTFQGQADQAMLVAIEEVMNNNQDLINEPGKEYKGFLPAVFAKEVADVFSKEMFRKMSIKLTAPKNYVRNRDNRPDNWEHRIIESKFRTPEWENGKTFFENSEYNRKPVYRFILPEYYKESCLKCHGGTRGDIDMTGGKKEGGTLGELGGAISVVIYDNAFLSSVDD